MAMTEQLKEESISTRLTFARRNDLKKILRQLDKDSAEARYNKRWCISFGFSWPAYNICFR